ncbi:MAG: bifunctional class I SAM-dependent methyltransferase/glycosyltransferase family 2 protein [Candidatus Solibacter sp.]
MEVSTSAGTGSKDYPGWARAVRRDGLASRREDHVRGITEFFDHYAQQVTDWRRRNASYHREITSLSQFYIPAGARVLEIGSGPGDLLSSLKPRRGVGIDTSGEMVRLAKANYPDLEFHQMAVEELELGGEKFDYIILSDLVGYLYDIRLVFERLRAVCEAHTRIIIHWYSLAWQPVLTMAEKLGLKYPQPLVNWTTREDITNLLYLADFEAVQRRQHILLPKYIPLVSSFVNRFLAPLPIFRALTVTNWVVARPLHLEPERAVSISVICPCRNEAGNIEQIVNRLPEMGSHTELILVEGHSKDNTLAECHRVAAANPGKDIRVLQQTGRGKGDAVRLGFAEAKGDILIILDADISVAPEDLVDFYDALAGHKGDFINGCRLVYSMDPEAMRFLNLLGNKFFAFLLSKLMGQPIKDSLCGTKALWRPTYLELAAGRPYFGEFDPFGDFDLLFGAAKLNLKITEIPVRYRQRTYGSTNINRFADGSLLLRMCAKAAAKLFFIR